AQVKVTGKKTEQKRYYRYTGYPGGLRVEEYRKLIHEKPERVLRHAVWGMLPHNSLGRKLLKKLKIYPGPEHPHQAQQPEPLPLN
ncbi:MAG: 50S ribosomal protein L13, partial [Calditrichaeota bacterium]|nr:50S ribosomal protein L13 [Calditrichota bacterium]